MPQLTQYGTRPASSKPRTTSFSSTSTIPNCDLGRATVTVATADVSRWRRSSAAKSTATSSSPFSASTSPDSCRAPEANLMPPPRPSRSGSSAATTSAPSPASSRSKSAPCPAAQETITRPTPARASRATWQAASGLPATSTSAFGLPAAASPSRSALPPARRIASTRRYRSRAVSRSGVSGRTSVSAVGRPMPSYANPARRVASGSSRLRPSTISGVRIAARLEDVRGDLDAARKLRSVRDRVPRAHLRALGEQPRGEDDRRRLAHVVGARLERQPEQRDGLPVQVPEVALELADHTPLLQLVHLDHGGQQLEVVAAVRRELLERERILRKARAPVPDARAQEVRAEAVVEPDTLGDLDDVGAGRLADVRDLVDERDARHQERVGRELDHLGRVDVAAHDPHVERRVQRGDGGAVGVVERADDDPVGVHEVADGAAFREELWIRDVPEVAEAALVETGAHLLPRPDGHRRLHHQHRAARQVGQLVDDRPDTRQVGVAGVRRRRVDADEEELAADEIGDVEREREPLAVALEQLRNVGLVERHRSATEGLHLLRDDVAHDHVVPQVGEAGAGDDADPARPEDAYPRHATPNVT